MKPEDSTSNAGQNERSLGVSTGGRRWWAHLAFAPMNIAPIILRNQIEDLMNIQGIGEKRFLELKPQIVVTPFKAAQ